MPRGHVNCPEPLPHFAVTSALLQAWPHGYTLPGEQTLTEALASSGNKLPGQVASGKQTWMLATATAMASAKEWEFKSSHVRWPLPWGAGGTA